MLGAVTTAAAVATLGAYNISDVTTSGLSAGAYMAVQMHVAYSETVSGAAVFAGGPYFCAKANLNTAEMQCMSYMMGGPDVEQLISYTDAQALQKTIDSPSNMKDDKVFLFSGRQDGTVDPKVMKSLETYYSNYIDASGITTSYNVNAEHLMPTLDYGSQCTRSISPYIGKCAYDGAGEGFQALYGTNEVSRGTTITKNLFEFDQSPFVEKGTSLSSLSLDQTGYIYVPTACADGSTACHLHIAFHGCVQTQDDIGSDYAEHSGYNEWAEASNIIVVYPYAIKSTSMTLYNPNGCWDWWAYTGKDYTLKSGAQMKFAKAMIDTLSGNA